MNLICGKIQNLFKSLFFLKQSFNADGEIFTGFAQNSLTKRHSCQPSTIYLNCASKSLIEVPSRKGGPSKLNLKVLDGESLHCKGLKL